MNKLEAEKKFFKRYITEIYPSGICSYVSDTFDFFGVITEVVPTFKEEILARAGKVVIRPDSGDPVKIVCGDPAAHPYSPEGSGAVECLWDVFGGTVTPQGYKVLDSHIGLIYGDSITPERAQDILHRLKEKGFASTNIVFGIGSYTYQYVTRDTHGFAVKSTYGEVNGVGREIFKDPKTDSGTKKSARGLLQVHGDKLLDCCPTEDGGDLQVVYRNGKLLKDYSLQEVRNNLQGSGISLLTSEAA